MSTSAANAHYIPVREEWLARRTEPALDPALPIIDPHHHLWDRPTWRYLLDDLLADTNQGHTIVSTVFIQCRAMHRAAGPEAFKPVGETEFVTGIAAMSASGGYGPTKVCAGIVGHVDLTIGAAAREVLEAHIRAGGGRFRGIRHITAWDPDPVIMNPAYQWPREIFEHANFRAGFAQLAPLGLSFDAWLYHPQIRDLAGLARAFPETSIVLDHVGGPLGIRGYAGKRDQVFADWKAAMEELARCPNVCVKLGGLGMRINGMGFEEKAEPPSSDDRHDDRALRRRPLHVREQLPGRQGQLRLRRVLERLQEARFGRECGGEDRAVQRHGGALLPARLIWGRLPPSSPRRCWCRSAPPPCRRCCRNSLLPGR